jgi:hypothetical protein
MVMIIGLSPNFARLAFQARITGRDHGARLAGQQGPDMLL